MSRIGHAIVSGGSSGIGLALARLLVLDGCRVTILARDPGRLAGAAAGLGPASASLFHADSVDVTDAAATARAVGAAIERFGPPDLVVACAGRVIPGRFEELSLDDFGQSMQVNYLGALHLVRAALPALRLAGRGRIVFVSSGAGLLGLYGYSAYAPSKFAVRGLAEALRSELAPSGIGVSVVYPPDTDTPQLKEEQRLRPEPTRRIAAGARILSAEQVASAILAGIRHNRFIIAPGWEMAALARLHSLIGPLLHRFWFDRLVRASLRQDSPGTRAD